MRRVLRGANAWSGPALVAFFSLLGGIATLSSYIAIRKLLKSGRLGLILPGKW